jgi:hypothetical protein
MKYLTLLLIVFSPLMVLSQNWHAAGKIGVGNYSGDMKSGGMKLAWSIGARYDINEHFIGRAFFNATKLNGNDAKNNNPRNLNFTAKLREIELGIQYQIFSLNEKWWTPYVFVGGSLFFAKPFTEAGGNKVFLQPLSTEGQGFVAGKKTYKTTNIAIPFGLGAEYALGEDVRVGLEFGFRKTFTDYIDDVSTTYADAATLLSNRGAQAVALAYRGGGSYPSAGSIRGNSANKDNFYFVQLTLTVRPFVDQYKRTSGIAGMKKSKKVGCPQTKGIF